MFRLHKDTSSAPVNFHAYVLHVGLLGFPYRSHKLKERITPIWIKFSSELGQKSGIRHIVYVLGSYGIDQPRRPPPPTSHSAESSPQHQSNHSSPHHQQVQQGQPGAAGSAGSAGFLSSLKGGAGSLMKNIKDASSKVAHTISQTAS